MEAVTRGTEAIGRELDSVLDIIGRVGAPQQEGSARPPASKKVCSGTGPHHSRRGPRAPRPPLDCLKHNLCSSSADRFSLPFRLLRQRRSGLPSGGRSASAQCARVKVQVLSEHSDAFISAFHAPFPQRMSLLTLPSFKHRPPHFLFLTDRSCPRRSSSGSAMQAHVSPLVCRSLAEETQLMSNLPD